MDRPVTCQQCGGTMRKTKKTDSSMTLQLVRWSRLFKQRRLIL